MVESPVSRRISNEIDDLSNSMTLMSYVYNWFVAQDCVIIMYTSLQYV